jgi:hypothetical protein
MIVIIGAAAVFVAAGILAVVIGRGELRGGHGRDDRD